MMTHAIYPGLTELPLCAGVAYGRGDSAAAQALLQIGPYFNLATEPHAVDCTDCLDWIHA